MRALSLREQRFLRAADRTGLVTELETKAFSKDDERRVTLARELATFTPEARDQATRQALDARLKAAAALQRAEAVFIAARNAARETDALLRAAEATFDARASELRHDLVDIAPESIVDTCALIYEMRERVRGAVRFWTDRVFTFGGATNELRSNGEEVAAAAAELETLRRELSELAFAPLAWAEIGARCDAALAKGERIARPFIGADGMRLARERLHLVEKAA